jgi:predicted O-methyltransferase YrrM
MMASLQIANIVFNKLRWYCYFRAWEVHRIAIRIFLKLPKLTLKIPLGIIDNAILQDACMPPLVKHCKHDDLTHLLSIISIMQPQLVVEFGTAHGNTTANICRVSEAHIVTVNALPEEIGGKVVTFVLSRNEIGRVYREHGFTDRVMQVYANTLYLDLSQYVSPGSVDLAIIDACHDEEYVSSDFMRVVPFMRQGGIVLLHDTHPSMEGHLKGSYMACTRLRQKGWNISWIENTWWGIWVNGRIEHSCLKSFIVQN